MTVADNVARVDEAGAADAAEHALERVGLAARRQVLVSELSLVEQRRLEVARALGRSPRLLLLDEPTSGLGPQETEDMIRLLADAVLPGRAVILAEHKPHVIAELCPSAALLDQGRKSQRRTARRAVRGDGWGCQEAGDRTMRPALIGIAIMAAGAGLGATATLAADRASALIDCKATAERLVYDCTIQLTNARTAAPLEQATLIDRRRHAIDADGPQCAPRDRQGDRQAG